jgi:Calx-beta domain/SdrD B-like domain/Dockerin type I domain
MKLHRRLANATRRNHRQRGNRLRRAGTLEVLEGRVLLAGDTAAAVAPLQNFFNHRDVNHDGHVSPIDALLVIHDLMVHGSHQVSPSAVPLTSGAVAQPTAFLDVNGDNRISAVDALSVIHTLLATQLAEVDTVITDLADNPITSVAAGTDFKVHVIATDTRDPVSATPGIFSAYVNLMYDSNLVSIDPQAPVPGPKFSLLNNFMIDVSTPGQIPGFLAISGANPAANNAPEELWSIVVHADSAGTAVFAPSFDTDSSHDTTMYPDVLLNDGDILFNQASVTVTGPATVSVGDVTALEGNSGQTPFVFTVSLGAAATQSVVVGYATQSGTATAPSDYIATSGSLTFDVGQSTKLVTVLVNGDSTVEADETFTLQLTAGLNATLGNATAVGTILNDDAIPALAVSSLFKGEGNAGNTDFVFTASLSSLSSTPIVVSYATSDGTATTANNDYIAQSGTLTFAPGQNSKLITISVVGDTVTEPDETFNLTLTAVSGSLTNGPVTGTGTIVNDEGIAALIRLQVADSQGNPLAPGASLDPNANFVLQAYARDIETPPNGIFQAFVDINYDTSLVMLNGAITAGANFQLLPGGSTSTPGLIDEEGAIGGAGQPQPENRGSEMLLFSVPFKAIGTGAASFDLSSADGQGHEILIYTNDNPIPPSSVNYVSTSVGIGTNVFDISDVALTEGNAGGKNFVFSVTRFQGSESSATVAYGTSNGTATTVDNDYVATSGTLTFAPGQDTAFVTVVVNGDTKSELDETFSVTLSNAVGAGISKATGIGTILDDDGPVTIVAGDASASEGQNMVFTVSLSAPSGQTVTVPFNTAPSTGTNPATAGLDYTPTSGVLSFAPGVTVQNVTVVTKADTLLEQDETFLLQLGTPSGALAGPSSVQGTILDVVPSVAISVNDVTHAEGNSGFTNFLFTVTLSQPTTLPVLVNFTTTNGTATAGSDYVGQSGLITFNPLETSKIITVQVIGDVAIEDSETFSLILSSSSIPVTSAPQVATGTITNDDGAPLLFISDTSVVPGSSGITNAVFTVTLSATATDNVTVGYATQDFTATANVDYFPQSGILTFVPGGSLAQTITVPVLGQPVASGDEAFFVNLSSASANAQIGDAQGVGTIVRQGITVGDISLLEGNSGITNAVFTITLSQPQGHSVVVNYNTIDGTATAGSDYTATSGSVTLSDNALSAPVTVQVSGDTDVEANETFFLHVTSEDATVLVNQGKATILNDDGTLARVRLQIGDAAGTPLAPGATLDPLQTFTLLAFAQDTQLSPQGIFQAFVDATYDTNLVQFLGPITIGASFQTQTSGSAATPGLLDEVGGIGGLTPPANPGAEQLLFKVPFKAIQVGLANFGINAADLENHEVLEFGRDTPLPADQVLLVPTSVNIGHNIFTVGNISANEGNAGTTNFVFTVSWILPDPNTNATVVFQTADQTATAASGDYVPKSGTLTFAAGDSTATVSQTVTVAVNGDTTDEPNETFLLNLLNATGGATASLSPGIGTIINDDLPVGMSIAGASGNEGDDLNFVVTLSAVSGKTVTVPFNTAASLSGNVATAGSDYVATSGTLTFAPGVTQQTISVHALNDIVAEPNETFRVVLGTPTNGTRTVGEATGTIIDVPPATITGFVYVDLNNNGIKDANESGIANVTITATSATGVTTSTLTTADGSYSLVGLFPGVYTVSETQPGFYTDGRDTHAGVDSPTNDKFTGVVLAPSATVSGYNFGELGVRSDFVSIFINRRALFATAMTTGEFGPQMSAGGTVNPKTGDLWVSFDGGWNGQRTIDAAFNSSQGSCTMTLYNNNLQVIATSFPTGTGAQLIYNGTTGAAYFLRISGTNASVALTFHDPVPNASPATTAGTSSDTSSSTNLRAGMLATSAPTATPQAAPQTAPSATDPVWTEDNDWVADSTLP